MSAKKKSATFHRLLAPKKEVRMLYLSDTESLLFYLLINHVKLWSTLCMSGRNR